jgi:hypothetical protein
MFSSLERLSDGWNRFWAIFFAHYSVPVFAASIIYLVFSQFIGVNKYLLLASAILNFSAFDVIGFRLANDTSLGVTLYRVIQVGYQLLILYILYMVNQTFELPLAFIWLWWWGVCDLLYYIIAKQFDYVLSPNSKNFYWLWWTPYGLLGGLFHVAPTGRQLLGFSVFSILLYLIANQVFF